MIHFANPAILELPPLAETNILLMGVGVIGLVFSIYFLVWAISADDKLEALFFTALAVIAFLIGGAASSSELNRAAVAKEAQAESVQTWLDKTFEVTVSTDEAEDLLADQTLIVDYDGEMTSVSLRDVAGGGISIVSEESLAPLKPVN